MNFYLSLPFLFLKFWFVEGPKEMIAYFASLNDAFLQLFSLPLLIKTFFRPWKNEYRKGLVGVSIAIGIVIKTFVILADLVILLAIITVEFICILSFILWPIATIYILFR